MVGAGYLQDQRVPEPHQRDLGEGVEVSAHLVEILVDPPGFAELRVAESVHLAVLSAAAEHQMGVSLHLKLEEGLPGVAAAGEQQLEPREFRPDEQLAEGFVESRGAVVPGRGVLVAEAFVHRVEEDEDPASLLGGPLVEFRRDSGGVLSRRGAEDAPQGVRKGLGGEVGAAEYQHCVVASGNLLRPPAELVGLALARLAQQGEQGPVAGGEFVQQGAQALSLHEEFAVVFLLAVDAAQEASRLLLHQRAHLRPVHLSGDVEGGAAALEQTVEVGVEAVVYQGHRVFVGGDVGDLLVLERLEHVFVAFPAVEHQRVQVGAGPFGRGEAEVAAADLEAEILKGSHGFEHRQHLGFEGEHDPAVDFVGEGGAVALVFVAYPHHARLRLGAEQPVGTSAEQHRAHRLRQRVVRKLLRGGPDYGVEDVVDPVAEREGALGVDLIDYGLHRAGVGGQSLLGVLEQHEEAAAHELHADFEEVERIVHACGEVVLLHFPHQGCDWFGERGRQSGDASGDELPDLLLPFGAVAAQEGHVS